MCNQFPRWYLFFCSLIDRSGSNDTTGENSNHTQLPKAHVRLIMVAVAHYIACRLFFVFNEADDVGAETITSFADARNGVHA